MTVKDVPSIVSKTTADVALQEFLGHPRQADLLKTANVRYRGSKAAPLMEL